MASHCSSHLNYIFYSNWQISQQIESQVFSFLIISAFFFISGQCGWLFNFFVWSVSVTILLFLVCWPQFLLCLVCNCECFNLVSVWSLPMTIYYLLYVLSIPVTLFVWSLSVPVLIFFLCNLWLILYPFCVVSACDCFNIVCLCLWLF